MADKGNSGDNTPIEIDMEDDFPTLEDPFTAQTEEVKAQGPDLESFFAGADSSLPADPSKPGDINFSLADDSPPAKKEPGLDEIAMEKDRITEKYKLKSLDPTYMRAKDYMAILVGYDFVGKWDWIRDRDRYKNALETAENLHKFLKDANENKVMYDHERCILSEQGMENLKAVLSPYGKDKSEKIINEVFKLFYWKHKTDEDMQDEDITAATVAVGAATVATPRDKVATEFEAEPAAVNSAEPVVEEVVDAPPIETPITPPTLDPDEKYEKKKSSGLLLKKNWKKIALIGAGLAGIALLVNHCYGNKNHTEEKPTEKIEVVEVAPACKPISNSTAYETFELGNHNVKKGQVNPDCIDTVVGSVDATRYRTYGGTDPKTEVVEPAKRLYELYTADLKRKANDRLFTSGAHTFIGENEAALTAINDNYADLASGKKSLRKVLSDAGVKQEHVLGGRGLRNLLLAYQRADAKINGGINHASQSDFDFNVDLQSGKKVDEVSERYVRVKWGKQEEKFKPTQGPAKPEVFGPVQEDIDPQDGNTNHARNDEQLPIGVAALPFLLIGGLFGRKEDGEEAQYKPAEKTEGKPNHYLTLFRAFNNGTDGVVDISKKLDFEEGVLQAGRLYEMVRPAMTDEQALDYIAQEAELACINDRGSAMMAVVVADQIKSRSESKGSASDYEDNVVSLRMARKTGQVNPTPAQTYESAENEGEGIEYVLEEDKNFISAKSLRKTLYTALDDFKENNKVDDSLYSKVAEYVAIAAGENRAVFLDQRNTELARIADELYNAEGVDSSVVRLIDQVSAELDKYVTGVHRERDSGNCSVEHYDNTQAAIAHRNIALDNLKSRLEMKVSDAYKPAQQEAVQQSA